MYIHGELIDRQGRIIALHILTRIDRSRVVEIGVKDGLLYFQGEEAISLSTEVNDTFDVLLPTSATIRLLARRFVPELFCASCLDAVVNIFREGRCLFAGYIEPQTYSQPYNEELDELELNCIDALSALQSLKYRNIGLHGVSYEAVKAGARTLSFQAVATEVLGSVTRGLDITGRHPVACYYDGSKAVSSEASHRWSVLDDLSVSELLFLGEEASDEWTAQEVLAEMLKMLNLHLLQQGTRFYLFSWESVRSTAPIAWRNLQTGEALTTARQTIEISNENVANCETTISIEGVHNRLVLTCDAQKIENLIVSPLEQNALVPLYSAGKEHFCTELTVAARNEEAYWAFHNLVHDKATTHDRAAVTDWWVRVMRHPHWEFPGQTLHVDKPAGVLSQYTDLAGLTVRLGAGLFEFGYVEKNMKQDDNNPVAKIKMDTSLVLSVNGNGRTDADTYPKETDLQRAIPYARYTGTGGGNLSPVGEGDVNYLFITGKMVLAPHRPQSESFKTLFEDKTWRRNAGGPGNYTAYMTYFEKAVSIGKGKEGFYVRKYWLPTEGGGEVPDLRGFNGFIPFSDKCEQQLKFEYSGAGDATDRLSKVPVVACMLVVGDKCLVEVGSEGRPEDYRWQTYKTPSQCANLDEYHAQSFTIGFNPKIGDYLIGTEFDIQNNVHDSMSLGKEGMAIPIKKADRVQGDVQFSILGPVNAMFDNVTKRHRTWFRREKWTTTAVPLLPMLSHIELKDFEVQIVTPKDDHAETGNDIVYLSEDDTSYSNARDDLSFRIHSALTAQECKALGVEQAAYLSTPTLTGSGEALTTIYHAARKEQDKPERLYLSDYYDEYHTPKVQMQQTLRDEDEHVGPFHHYRHPALGKEFYPIGVDYNLHEGEATLKLKEL